MNDKNLHKQAGGEWFINKILEGTSFAGTGTKQELVELEKNLRQLIQVKMYPYKYIEDFLVSQGYHYNDIRQVFNEVTGVAVEDFLESDSAIMETPACVPSYNLGWGPAKSKVDFYFIMPWAIGYSIFSQKDDLEREEIDNFTIIEDARAAIKGLVKEYHQYNKVVDLDLNKPKSDWYDGFSEPRFSSLSEQGTAMLDYLKVSGTLKAPKSALAYVKDGYFNGLIGKEDFTILSAKFIKEADLSEVEKEEVEEKQSDALATLEDDESSKMLQDELKESSPQDFFDNQVDDEGISDLGPIIDSVTEYLRGKEASIAPEFKLLMPSLKYQAVATYESNDSNVNTQDSKPIEFLNSSGVVSVMLEIVNTKMPEGSNTKKGYIVFSIIDGQLQTTGTFKGKDRKLYALDKQGLTKYFDGAEKHADIPLF